MLLLTTLAIGTLLQDQGAPLRETWDIVDFEFALTTSQAERILADWEGLHGTARGQLWLDMVWIVVGYAPLLFMLGLAAWRVWVASVPPSAGWAGVAAIGGATAGGFDVAENLALLVVIENQSQPWPALAAGFAAIKFTLAGVALAFAVVAFACGAIAWLRAGSAQP